jgi:hypothetical protein
METPTYLHTTLPVRPWEDAMARRLPGIQPIDFSRWLIRDDVYDAQMEMRDKLLLVRREDVYAAPPPEADTATRILLGAVLAAVKNDPAYTFKDDGVVIRPDGVEVNTRKQPPLLAAARLVQEDLLLTMPDQTEHVLTGGVLCFPASWNLAEKLGRPLASIHQPVPRYNATIAGRVQRLISNLRPNEPVWRANAFRYNSPDLFHPRHEKNPRRFDETGPCFVRVEYQTLMRLPGTEAVVFTIHTYMAPGEALTKEQMAAMLAWQAEQ